MNYDDVRRIVVNERGGPVEEIHGPYRLNGFDVWQVWVKPGGEYETRFVVSKDGKPPGYCDNFGSLAVRMEGNHHAVIVQGSDRESKTLANIMAAIGFVIALALLVYLVVSQAKITGEILALVASLLASAGAYYYRAWKVPK